MIPAAALIEGARTWLGVPYLHQGRSRDGVDCLGLVICLGWQLGFLAPGWDFRLYSRQPFRSLLETNVALLCRPAPGPLPGVLAVIQFGPRPAHLGIVTGPTIVHACGSRERVVEHGYRGRWIRMTHSFWALPGVALGS